MELTLGSSVALISLLYLSIVTSPASAKCRGSFRFDHACLGGNGKRSDPSMALSAPEASAQARNSRRPSLLNKALLSGFGRQDLPRPSSDKTWPESVESYLSSAYPAALQDIRAVGAGEATNAQQEDNSYDTRLELALAEVLELRKYTTALERLLRASSSDIA